MVMDMTAKESKAVAWICTKTRNKWDEAGLKQIEETYTQVHTVDTQYAADTYRSLGYTIIPLVPESALHAAESSLFNVVTERNAAEAAYKETERDRRRWAIRAESTEAELGELRRRVGELAAHWENFYAHGDDAFSDPADEAMVRAAAELRQLLASDGGADGEISP